MPDETIAEYDIRSPASRTILTVVGTLVAVALLGGAVLGVSLLMRDTRVAMSSIDLTDASQIVIRAGDADLRLVPGDQDGVLQVRAEVTSGLRRTQYELGRRDDEIRILSSCQRLVSPGCGVTVTLEVPLGYPLVVETGSGNVSAQGLEGTVLTVRSGSGDVSAADIALDELSVETASGDVSATFAGQPSGLKIDTGSGDVRAVVPDGDVAYAVSATSTSGEVSSSIDSDDDGEGFIRVTTSSGDIDLS